MSLLGSDVPNARGNASNQVTPAPKRRRLNLACNYCRSRKTRCDEQKPSCHACLAAGLVCVTTDPRRPHHLVERREAGKGPDSPSVSTHSADAPAHLLQPRTVSNSSPGTAPFAVHADDTDEGSLAQVEEVHASADDNHDPHNNATGRRFRGLLPIFKHEVSSTSVDVLTGWLNVASFRLGLGHCFAPRTPLMVGQHHDPFPSTAPSLSNLVDTETRISHYFKNVHPVYPVVNRDNVYTALEEIRTHGIMTLVSTLDSLPQIVEALVAVDIGSSGIPEADPDRKVYAFVKDLLGRLIGRPTFPNIKALFLLALDMYHHDDVASAWSTLTLCCSMAIAVGLGKSRNLLAADLSYNREDGMRTWWSIFVLENLISFETGRKSSLCFEEYAEMSCTTIMDNAGVHNNEPSAQEQTEAAKFFKTIVGFAKVLGEIGTRCIDIRDREEASGTAQIQRLVAEKVKITAECCIQLMHWAESLPDYLRPGSDLIYERRTFAHAAFISLHYYNALLALLRNSLLISDTAHQVTQVISKDEPWGHVIRNGQPMVASTARKLIKLFIDAEESEAALLVPHTNAALHALYVLAVHLMRHPDTMLRKTDLDLIHHAARFAKKRMRTGTIAMEALCSLLGTLDNALEQGPDSNPAPRTGTISLTLPQNQSESHRSPQPLSRLSADVSMDPISSSGELLGRYLGPDDYDNTAFYYGMDIGTWIGLDSVVWDAG
ncbi:hypothetical protein C7974DRAFT_390341 [Boeremia exigua]|uniref:uncharacterized protein n=1 Tax=Boeremia exigua TaxID=749465 RepID=UPI001E8CBE91|nr:uncharacterized protein C7974DRAFT_390341 [Boeremia exigua]KAH6637831.1 hypothetical protein C7974DRAFT_390341 [Boeremia exigua]